MLIAENNVISASETGSEETKSPVLSSSTPQDMKGSAEAVDVAQPKLSPQRGTAGLGEN